MTSEENNYAVAPLSSGQGTPGDEAEIPARISVLTATGGDRFPTVGRSVQARVLYSKHWSRTGLSLQRPFQLPE